MRLPDDETLDAALADPEFRKALQAALSHAGIETPLDELSREDQRYYVGQALTGIEAAQELQSGGDADMGGITDQFLDEALADEQLRPAMEKILRENGINEPITELPRGLLKSLLQQMYEYASMSEGGQPN